MSKYAITITFISVLILAVGFLLPENTKPLVNKTQNKLFFSDSVDTKNFNISQDKGFIAFTIDSNICGVCVTNIHDYTTLAQKYQPNYSVIYLIDENASKRSVQKFASMIGIPNPQIVKFSFSFNNIHHRKILFGNSELFVKGEKTVLSNAIPEVEQKKKILEKGVSLITN